ncbi:flagellar biosynthetic protein FliQ [bacterium]|nr:flagellar biosynthetic protein FliQ [bacterium]
MNELVAMNLVKDTMWMAMMVGLPPLMVGLVVGLAVSVFQTTTSLQEQTLTFIPKVVATMSTVIALGPWMISKISSWAINLINNIDLYIG